MIYNSKFDVDKIDEKTLNEFRKSGVIVFGTGNYGILTLHALKQKNIKLICFVDNKVSNWNTNFKGYKVGVYPVSEANWMDAGQWTELNKIADALLEYEAISGDEMQKVINGEAIVRIESKEKKKRVRRRKKVKGNVSENSDSAQPIITKPAT